MQKIITKNSSCKSLININRGGRKNSRSSDNKDLKQLFPYDRKNTNRFKTSILHSNTAFTECTSKINFENLESIILESKKKSVNQYQLIKMKFKEA